MTTSRTSRRTVLAALATMPAASIASPDASNGTDADAELIGAWHRVLELEKKLDRAKELDRPFCTAFDKWFADTGGKHFLDDEFVAVADRLERQFPRPEPACDDIVTEMDGPMRKVMYLPAHTPAGLAAKAHLVRTQFKELWQKPAADLDWPDQVLRALVDSVLNYGTRAPAVA